MSIVRSFEELCALPQDILSDTPIIKMYGAYELYISNYKGLLEYSPCLILLQCHHCRVRIAGECLMIRSYDQVEMNIRGNIHTVSLLS